MEIVSKKIRSEICILVQLGWTLGNLVLSLVMSLLSDYVHLERCLIAIQVLLLVWSVFLKESPKWLLLNGHYTQAERTLAKAGKNFDKLTIYEIKGRLMLLREHLIEQEVNQKFNQANKSRSSKEQYQLIFKALSLVFTWFTVKLIYFSVSYYPELFTRGNGHFLGPNVLYQSLVELIAFLLTYVLVKFTRRRVHTLVFALFFLGIAIFGELLFFKLNYFQAEMTNYYFKLAFMLVIKFASSLIIQFLLLFTGECFNENLHQKIYGYSMALGFVGAALASFVPLIVS